ncbi:hypothetical protein L204_105689 [Cryptococcus depauperatus]
MLFVFGLAVCLSALAVNAVPCVQFDASWNLYAFGGNQDVKIGDSSSWSSPKTSSLSSNGRPSWTGKNTQCILSQSNNAMYVIGADSDLSKIYIYDFAGDSWSTQSTSGAPSDLGNSRSSSVLDHDTNVLFTLTTSSGLYQLDLSNVQKSASGNTVGWEAVMKPSFSVDGYTVAAAQAANHIFYFGVPKTAAGSANVFIVHYAYFQPDAQAFHGTAFPDSAGQAISIPNSQGNVPYSMVFVPDDFSNTFIATHWTNPGDYSITTDAPFSQDLINSTQILAAPSSKDKTAAYAASPNAIVQVNSAGDIYYISNPVNSDYTVSSGASWQKFDYSVSVDNASKGSGNSTTTDSASGSHTATKSATSSASHTSSKTSASSPSSALQTFARGDIIGLVLATMVLGAGLLL